MAVKCTILGASGGIGQPLSLLCKNCSLIGQLSLYDVVSTIGISVDLSHICTPSKVKGYAPSDESLKEALIGSDVVVIPAGMPRRTGMTRDDLFSANSKIVINLGKAIAEYSPNAYILVITNPINSIIPIIVEVLKGYNVFNPRKIFGITTLDTVRASTFVTEYLGEDSKPGCYNVPVVGGHSGTSIVPLLSQSNPKVKLTQEQLESLIHRIQYGGDEVIKAKDGNGSATLSMAYAAFIFIEAILKARTGVSGIVQCSYVYLPGIPGGDHLVKKINLDFFSAPVELGVDGAQRVTFFDSLSNYEEQLLKIACQELQKNIEKGISFYTQFNQASTHA